MDLSISIVTYNSAQEVRGCLESTFRETSPISKEVFVVDNVSNDGTADIVAALFPQVRLVRNQTNVGYAAANNLALRNASGRYFLMLNPDTVVQPSALAETVRFLDANADAGAAGCRVTNPDGTLQMSCRSFPTLAAAFFNRKSLATRLLPANRLSRRYLMSDWDHKAVRDVDWITGCFLMFRRAALDDVGPFDEDYFLYFEDVDICYRLKQAGWRVSYVPCGSVMHRIGGSSDKTRAERLRVAGHFHDSLARFYRKHYSRKYPLPINAAVMAGIRVRRWIKRLACYLPPGARPV